jgi:membrane associated rhomboid family serine protease
MNGYGRGLMGLPPVVKNIILINILMLLVTFVVKNIMGIDLTGVLGLYFPKSEHFLPLQIITHMFMHGGLMHLFFNMFALYMFGGILENVWGPKRFFVYYMVCGLGAALVHESVIALQYSKLIGSLGPDQLQLVLNDGNAYFSEGRVFADEGMKSLQMLLNVPTVGASGAVFGILLAFGCPFPNTQLMLLFPPIPIKAKYLSLVTVPLNCILHLPSPEAT